MKVLRAIAVLAALAGPAIGGEAGDLVFAERGPWSLGDTSFHWTLTRQGPPAEMGFVPVENGQVTLRQAIDPSDQKPILQVVEQAGTRERVIGPFPISSGDPALTYFLESTVREIAALTGGSPFYIRNRVKDAVFRGGEVAAEGDHKRVTLRPFADDPNKARMQGFGDLTLSFTLDPDPSRPIRVMRAEAPAPGYLHEMVMK